MLEAEALVTVNLWQILISLANLTILFLILKKFLYKPARKMLSERRDHIDALYAEAENARAEAERDRNAYHDKMAGADEEARNVIRRAMTKANEMSDEILEDTGRKVTEMKTRAEAEIEQERKRALNSVKDDVAELSLDIAEKVIGREIGEDDHRELIDRFLEELGTEETT